jgi:sugar phosphate isomerase/epimerase
MQEPIRHYCRLGIVHGMAWPACLGGDGPVVESITHLAEDADFDVIEVGRINDPGARAEAITIAQQAGLDIVFAGQPTVLGRGLAPASLDADERRTAVDTLKADIDLAYEYGAQAFAFLSGKDPGDAQRADATKAMTVSTQELCDHASAGGAITVLLETFDRTIDKKSLIGPNTEAAALARLVSRDNFGLMLDLSHLPLQGETPREGLTAARDYLKHAHIGNCMMSDPNDPAYGDNHPRFGYPGGENGVAETAEFLRVLLDIGYLSKEHRPVLSFEVKPQPGESTPVIIANAKRTLAQAWAQV